MQEFGMIAAGGINSSAGVFRRRIDVIDLVEQVRRTNFAAGSKMRELFTKLVSGISVWDAIDVAIIAFVLYKALGFIRETRAEQLIKGLLILVTATVLSDLLHLNALNWILKGTMQFGVIALVVVLQPELRRGLEYVGRSKLFRPPFAVMDKENVKAMASSIVKAVDRFSVNKTGALIIMEREITLNDFAETGVVLNSTLSTELLGNIFYVGAPLHDGAAIIRGNRVFAAACVLPLTKNKELPKDLGTRHRAGIGVTEVSDALAIIVSEESGIISTAFNGNLTRFLDIKTLEKEILNMYLSDQPIVGKSAFMNFFRREQRNVSK
ncbi:MAG: diadenylate cyclase CdaA [Clostridiales Family XIII bacterium]|jgi:diadenylate cyclase|nr:diadenylate cyclase CdaA [Clostridiales Family XIII bacterium]